MSQLAVLFGKVLSQWANRQKAFLCCSERNRSSSLETAVPEVQWKGKELHPLEYLV